MKVSNDDDLTGYEQTQSSPGVLKKTEKKCHMAVAYVKALMDNPSSFEYMSCRAGNDDSVITLVYRSTNAVGDIVREGKMFFFVNEVIDRVL